MGLFRTGNWNRRSVLRQITAASGLSMIFKMTEGASVAQQPPPGP